MRDKDRNRLMLNDIFCAREFRRFSLRNLCVTILIKQFLRLLNCSNALYGADSLPHPTRNSGQNVKGIPGKLKDICRLNRWLRLATHRKFGFQPDGFSEAVERFACTMFQGPDCRNQSFNVRGLICRVFLLSTTIQWFAWPLKSFLNGTASR